MLQIYHVPRTRSIRAIWLCEELGVPYEAVPVEFTAEFKNSPGWRAISPTGKVPAMADGDFTMFESGAMVQYILEKHGGGRLVPEPGSRDSALCLQWSWFAEATLARPLGDVVHHTLLKPEAERIPAVVEDATERARTCLDALEHTLADRDYLLGSEFCVADIMMGYSTSLAKHLGILDDRYAGVMAYQARLEARAAWQRTMA
ncbi:MAG: glutathione S-transferase family protein [Acidobacteriota bacterium]|nr:glutathione S-transferase family protein [Acidobacteriota bacterium]